MTGGRSPGLDDAVRGLRAVILAGENYRQLIAQVTGLGVTETQALSYLAVHGDRGQNDLGSDLGLTSGSARRWLIGWSGRGLRSGTRIRVIDGGSWCV